MMDTTYPNDIQFAGLVQAATAAAGEQTSNALTLGKRKRDDTFTDDDSVLAPEMLGDAPDPAAETSIFQSSASVLFREPSTKSKKYSRPPLGKVFASLELAPEHFLRLQNAAKAFMLDEAHPERRDVVGQKKHIGGSDVAKLNLWNCVDEFLSLHGYGEKFFGAGAGGGVPDAPPRTMFWPRDSQAIIKLMMPLMRKMVTNERQRVYAATTRKQPPGKDSQSEQSPAVIDESIPSHDDSTEPTFPDQDAAKSPLGVQKDQYTPARDESRLRTSFKQSIVLYVNVVSNTGGALRRVIPRFELTPESAPNLSALVAEVNRRYKSATGNSLPGKEGGPLVKVWLTDGLVTVVEDGEWMVALLSAGVVDWMDGQVRVLVEV